MSVILQTLFIIKRTSSLHAGAAGADSNDADINHNDLHIWWETSALRMFG